MPKTRVFIWRRVLPDTLLLRLLRDSSYQPCLVFPSIYAVAKQPVFTPVSFKKNKKRPVFIIIDATWQQARKIYRKSPYLHHLPLFSFLPNTPSIYTLRRNKHHHHLCTAEIAAAVLDSQGDVQQASVMMSLLQVFCDRYEGAKLGQRPDNYFDVRRITKGVV